MELRDVRDDEGVRTRLGGEKETDGVRVWKEFVKRGIWETAASRNAACEGEAVDGL